MAGLGKWLNGALLAAVAVLSGCSAVHLPAIDPSGQRIFLPCPAYTTLSNPCEGIPTIPCWPVPAFQEPPPVPPCDPFLTPIPAVAVPVAPGPAVAPAPVAAPATTPAAPRMPQDRLVVTPTRIVAPVGTEVILLSGICGPDGHYVKKQPVEWSLSQESVGNFVDAGETCDLHTCSWLKHNPPQKRSGSFAVTKTSHESRMLTRGTASKDDDVLVKSGQSWVSLTSGSAGVSYVTAVARGAENWDQRRQLATVIWVDAQWSLPAPAIVAAGQAHVLTTTLNRSSDNLPATNWIVRYEVAGGAPAGFAPNGQSAAEVATDANGRASVQLLPQSAQPGVTQVRIQIISPVNGGDASSRVVVGQGWTSVTWSAPGLTLRMTGPAELALDATATFRIEAANPGDLATRNVTVSVPLPPILRFLSSNPAAEVFGARVQWRLGDLGPRDTRVIELSCRAVRDGHVSVCAQAQAEGNLATEACTAVTISVAAIEVRFVDPPTKARVGDRISFNVEVSNTGTVRIGNVVARDTFDAGLVHAAGETSPIVRSLGSLEPRAVSRFSVTFIARLPGRVCHALDVTGDGGQSAVARTCVDIEQVPLAAQVEVSGPPRGRVGEPLIYTIRVTNTGQGPLTNGRIAVYAVPSLLPEQASPDYRYHEGGLIWELGTLQPNEAPSRQVQCRCVRPDMRAEIRAVFTSEQGVSQTGTASTEIIAAEAAALPDPEEPGVAGGPEAPADTTGNLVLSVAGTSGAVPLGGTTSYILTVKNDRPASDRDVTVTFVLSEGLQFRSFDGGGFALSERVSSDGRTVTVQKVNELRAGETLPALRLEVTAAAAGTQRLRVQVTSLRHPEGVSREIETVVRGG